MTEPVFRTDPYARAVEAKVVEVNERGGIVLDRTVFYATGGGQPGDCGIIELADGSALPIATTVHGDDSAIVHVPADGAALPAPGAAVRAVLDWETRHRHMRMHTCLHLLCAVLPFPVTGGQIGAETGRLDFDIADASLADKEELTARLNALIREDHPVKERWISDEELAAKPDLVRTMAVKPPMGSGRVRLVAIGEDGGVDLQPCGGTHVASTAEIGEVVVAKIEKKGRQNRRIRLAFAG